MRKLVLVALMLASGMPLSACESKVDAEIRKLDAEIKETRDRIDALKASRIDAGKTKESVSSAPPSRPPLDKAVIAYDGRVQRSGDTRDDVVRKWGSPDRTQEIGDRKFLYYGNKQLVFVSASGTNIPFNYYLDSINSY